MNVNDPKLTAYALGELSEHELPGMEEFLSNSPEARQFVSETQAFTQALKAAYNTEALTETEKPLNLVDIRDDPWFWSVARPLAIAAAIAVLAIVGAVAVSRYQRSGDYATVNLPTGQAEAERVIVTGSNIPTAEEVGPNPNQAEYAAVPSRYAEPTTSEAGFNTAQYEHFVENRFFDPVAHPLSTFAVDVDTASYSNIRRLINEGSLPPVDAVRIEEMINYFKYDYPEPAVGKPFSINVEVAGCPWENSHRLVRIGLKGRDVAIDQRGPSNLVFLLDVSGSMDEPNRLPLVKQAMRLLVDRLTPNDRVAIVVYAGSSGLALPSTTGDHKEQILSAIEALEPGGSTNGAEGIQLAYQIAAENFINGGVNRVILATDGDFNVGVTSEGDLTRLIQDKARTGVFLTVLGVGDDNLNDSTMQKLADNGNGNYAYVDSLDEARKVLVEQINGTLVTIAKDVKVQVEFNPARVASYRLIGYENRLLADEDFNNDQVDAGEIGAGHTVTALYEVVPEGTKNSVGQATPIDPLKYQEARPRQLGNSRELLTVKLRHKAPDGDKSELIERALVDNGRTFELASADFRFAAAVAEFGMLLRDSEYKGSGTLDSVLEWAQGAIGNDPNGYRAGFIELVRKAQALRKG